MSATSKRNRDWYTTPAGVPCNWCYGGEIEPLDADDAELVLCRGHLAEYEGTSLDGLDREDAAMAADADALGLHWLDRAGTFPGVGGI